jgi:hypothetical protein
MRRKHNDYYTVQDVVDLHGGGGKTRYNEYNAFKQKIPKKYRIMHKTLFQRVFSSFLKHTQEQLLEQEGGVVLKGLGYWCIARSHVKRIVHLPGTDLMFYNTKNNMRPSRVLFFPAHRPGKYTLLRTYSMDYAINDALKDKVQRKIEAGKKYKVYPHTLRTLKLV